MINKYKNSQLAKGSSIFFLMKLSGMAFGYINIWLMSHYFGAGAVGVFSFILSVISFFMVFTKMGTGMATSKFVPKFLVKKDYSSVKSYYFQVLKITFLPGVVISLSLFFFSDFIANQIFNKSHYAPFLKYAALLFIPIGITKTHSDLTRGFKKMLPHGFLMFFTTFFTILALLAILVFTDQRNKELPTFVHLLSLSLMFIISFGVAFSLTNWFKIKTKKKVKIKDILKVSLPMMSIAIVGVIIKWADKIILSYYVSDAEIGIYHTMFRTSALLTLALMSVNAILAPKFSELYELGDFEKLKKIIHKSTKYITLITLPFFILIVVFAQPIAKFYGAEFTDGVFVLIVLSVGRMIGAWSGSVGIFLLMTGNEKFNQIVTAITAVFFIVSSIIFIPIYGINAVAVILSTIFIFQNLVYVTFVWKKYKILFLYLPKFRK